MSDLSPLVEEIERRRQQKRAAMEWGKDPRGWGLTFRLGELEELLGLEPCSHPAEDRSTLPPGPYDRDGARTTERCDRCGALILTGDYEEDR